MCGEKIRNDVLVLAEAGSPPRVRGEVWHAVDSKLRFGITPACAGRRRKGERQMEARQDHPRVCGEKSETEVLERGFDGSPPRVRGEVISIPKRNGQYRITPACAGRR